MIHLKDQKTVWNLSFHYSPRLKIPDHLNTPTRHFQWWLTHLMEGLPVFQIISSSEFITIWNIDISPHFEIHTQSDSDSSENLWTLPPQRLCIMVW
jgi:hypothetical protein